MLTQRLGILALMFTISTTAAVVACSSPPPKKATPKPADSGDPNGDGNNSQEQSSAQTTPPPAAAPPAAPVALPDAGLRFPDASLPPPPPGAQKPPAPTTRFCMALSQCCGSLPDMFQVLVCGGTAVAGNEDACGLELAVCQAGGIDTSGIGSLFQQDNPNCTALARCCGQFQSQGYTETANDCSGWVQIQDEGSCQQQLQTYQSFGTCF
jgi:hypothetical protein